MKKIFQSETMSAFRDWQPNPVIRILIAIAIWEFAAVITTIMWRVIPNPRTLLPWSTIIVIKTLVWQLWGLIVPIILAVARRYSIANTTNKIKNLTMLIILSIIILIVYGILYVATLEFYFVGKIMMRWTINYGQTFLTFHILYFFFGIWLLFLLEHVFSYTKNIRELSVRALRAESETQKAKLESIRSRLNPHFLYNSLNAISGLIVSGKRDEAADAVGRLGGLLRETLEHEAEDFVKLKHEFEIAREYIAIMKYRFGDKIKYIDEIDQEVSEAKVPSILLLPVIENAIKHGLGQGSGEVNIKLTATQNQRWVDISVTSYHVDSSADKEAASGFGIGLSSISERLEILYSADAKMQIIEESGNFQVLLSIPVEPPHKNCEEY